jgi:tetratricopeptide (TPR) repeat protein
MLEQIEKYIKHELSLSERKDFENQLATDSELAENTAFYLNANMAAKTLAIEKRKVEFEELRHKISKRPIRKIQPLVWVVGVAASILLVVGLWWINQPSNVNQEEFANNYIQEHFENLPVKMDANADSLQMGLQLLNKRKFKEAQTIFETILHRKNNDSESIKYAGITALRLAEYDKAIMYFKELSKQTNLFSNPGKFYEAITLMKKQPANKKEIEELLKEVINNNLEGKKEAEKISKQ